MVLKNIQLYCPQCGEDVIELHEGYCKDCLNERQSELNDYNFTVNKWANLSDEQRKEEIRNATR